MSVPQGDRGKGKLQVLRVTAEVARYTVSVCKNESVFHKAHRWLLTQPIANEAIQAYVCVRQANAIYVNRAQLGFLAEYQRRRTLQNQAYEHLESLLGLIDIAYTVINIESRRVDYWTGLIVEAEKLIKGWRDSDKERYLG